MSQPGSTRATGDYSYRSRNRNDSAASSKHDSNRSESGDVVTQTLEQSVKRLEKMVHENTAVLQQFIASAQPATPASTSAPAAASTPGNIFSFLSGRESRRGLRLPALFTLRKNLRFLPKTSSHSSSTMHQVII